MFQGALLKLLDVSSAENVLPTTYGKLCPPLGKHRLKIVEFISILLSIGGEVAEKELIRLGAIQHILDLFFEYPFNNFLHHHVENIVVSCLENTKTMLTEHVLQDCNLVLRLFGAEKQFTLATGPEKTTIPTEGRSPPRIGNIGHITRIANKLVYLGNNNNQIQALLQVEVRTLLRLQVETRPRKASRRLADGSWYDEVKANVDGESSEWMDWQMNVLLKRNTMENVYQWACGRPTAMQDRYRDSDDEDFRDKDYDVAALASNLSQAFRYGIYNNDEGEEVRLKHYVTFHFSFAIIPSS
ncbi:hypothetical protein GIB67_023803 [Kingdonia uniflora]|uniref:SIT4 phosphatase-associated family protein n=1 Tax=Kingdonia uniflora TaxID=39325 RepID=A0A7J7NGB1_9MAGN|nr:hypothetical protein GIB67_023803 [Kingdonia uniflora]